MDALRLQLRGPPNVVVIIRVPAIDDDIVRLQHRRQLRQRRIHHPRRTISHTVRGLSSVFTNSASDPVPTAPTFTTAATASADMS